MLNLLRSDFYRLFKSKFFYICTAVAIFLVAISIFAVKWSSDLSGSEMPYTDGISYGLLSFSNGNVQMIIAIITAIYVAAEFSHGTMKNVVSKGFSRVHIYLSRLIAMIVTSYIVIILCAVVGTICATIVTGTIGDLTGDYLVDILKLVGIELFLNAAYIAVLILIAMVVKNLGGVIAIDILGILTVIPLIYALLGVLFHNKIDFTKFSLLFNMAFYYNNEAIGADYLRSAIVGLVFFAVTTALGIFAFVKSDVK